MAKLTTVYDAEGVQRRVRAVDAAEIVGMGGSYESKGKKKDAEDESEELSLDSMSRKDLDALAVEKGLDPSEFKNKGEIVAALEEVE